MKGLIVTAVLSLLLASAERQPAAAQSTVDSNITPLMAAAQDGDTDRLKKLLDSILDVNAEINAKDKRGWTALTYAVISGEHKAVELLLEKGADIAAGYESALITAVRFGQTSLVKLLIKKGADVNAVSESGTTPLIAAARNKSKDVVDLLIDKGADLNAQDKHGNTALTYASRGGVKEIAERLRKAGGVDPKHGRVLDPSELGIEKVIESVDTRPIPLNAPRPNYTEEARFRGVQGIVSTRAWSE